MRDKAVSVSTREASELLGVHESSIKRWCNAGALGCTHTPGGHRRIPVDALVEFAQTRTHPLPLLPFGAEAAAVWAGAAEARQRGAFDELAALCYAWLDRHETLLPGALLRYLLDAGFPLARLFDDLLSPVMQRVGEGYAAGRLAAGDVHRMTQIARETLIELRSTVREAPGASPRPVAVVGCARNEQHELGALMVRLLLEARGWQVVYLGPDVPTEEFAAQQRKQGATLVCIWIAPPHGTAEAQSTLRLLRQIAAPDHPYRLALGGPIGGEVEKAPGPLAEVHVFRRITTFTRWLSAAPDAPSPTDAALPPP